MPAGTWRSDRGDVWEAVEDEVDDHIGRPAAEGPVPPPSILAAYTLFATAGLVLIQFLYIASTSDLGPLCVPASLVLVVPLAIVGLRTMRGDLGLTIVGILWCLFTVIWCLVYLSLAFLMVTVVVGDASTHALLVTLLSALPTVAAFLSIVMLARAKSTGPSGASSPHKGRMGY